VTLAETQALFHEVVTGSGPVAPERIDACFAGTPDLPARERVAIYAGMYVSRIVEALRETFPNLARQLGDERFAALAEDYVRRNPSEHHDIGRVGGRLAAFLRRHPDPGRPDLADLAELEWARQEVFFAARVEPAGPEPFAGLDPQAFARTGLALSPALRLLVLGHAAAPLWRRLEDGERPDPPAPGPAAVAVWRSGFEVFHAPLEPDEAAALEAAARGDDLARICAAFAGREDPAAAAHAALASWMKEGWIVGRREPGPGAHVPPGAARQPGGVEASLEANAGSPAIPAGPRPAAA
jgi:hypothetical protein